MEKKGKRKTTIMLELLGSGEEKGWRESNGELRNVRVEN